MRNIRFMVLFVLLSCLGINSHAQQWKIVSSKPLPSTMGFNGLSVVDKNTVWLAANDYSLWGVNGGFNVDPRHTIRIMKTTDGGNTWTIMEVPEAKGRVTLEICAVDSMNAWFSTNQFIGSDTRPIFKTKDGGRTWKKIETPFGAGGNIIHFFDQNEGILVNGFIAATSKDAGETWDEVPAIIYDLPTGENLLVIGTATSRAAYTDSTMVFGTDKGRIIFTKDRGKTFSFKQVGATNDLVNAITILNANHWIVVAPRNNQVTYNNPKVFQTLDAGITWTELARGQNRITHIAKQPGTLQTIFSSSIQQNGIKMSNTGFDNPVWEETLENGLYPYGMAFSKDGVGFAVTGDKDEENYIVKWTNAVSGNEEYSLDNVTVHVFPNPVTDQFTYQLPTEAGKIRNISIYDINGKKLFQNIDPRENMINMQDCPKGIYFLQIETHNATFNKKVIKF